MTRAEKAIKYIKDNNLTERNRTRFYVDRRQVAIKVLREEGYTLAEIGRIVKRDHATTLHNLRAYNNNIKYNDYQAMVDRVKLEADLFKTQEPTKHKTLKQKVLLCENYWQLRKLQEEIKTEDKINYTK